MRRPLDAVRQPHHSYRSLGQPGSGIGINVGQHSFAAILSNTIEDNADVGSIVHEASSARIGFSDVAARGAPNVIRNNQSYAVSPAGTVKGSKRVSQVRRNSTDGLR